MPNLVENLPLTLSGSHGERAPKLEAQLKPDDSKGGFVFSLDVGFTHKESLPDMTAIIQQLKQGDLVVRGSLRKGGSPANAHGTEHRFRFVAVV